ncbi:MAG: FecR domain-containing protein [Anaerolineae bacterium]|nr:FecR domain-containing protein [Anaerolineae bacterium]
MENFMQTIKIIKASAIILTILTFSLLAGCGLLPRNQGVVIATESFSTLTPGIMEVPKLIETPPSSRCDPFTATNDSGLAIITMPDGSQLFLGSNTEIGVLPAGYCGGNSTHNVTLKKGQVAVHSSAPVWATIVVTSPEGHIANIGASGLVIYDDIAHSFSLHCSNINCSMGRDVTVITPVECGVSMSLDINGNAVSLMPVDPAFLALFGDWLLPQCQVPENAGLPSVETPTLEATITVTQDTFAATATAFCEAYQRQFVVTPCPPLNP